MTIMFGIKLDEDLDRRITAMAIERGQTKSEIGRRALAEYIDRHALDGEFRRQLAQLADEDLSFMDDLEVAAFANPEWK